MAKTYYLRSNTSDLSGGADFSRTLEESTAGAATLEVSVAQGATEDSYAWTLTGEPGVDGRTGNYTVEVNVTVSDSQIFGRVFVARVNSSGVVQTGPTELGSEQNYASNQVYTFSGTSVNLGTWNSGDRLRVTYRFRNSHSHQARSVTIGFNTTSEEVQTPVSAAITQTATQVSEADSIPGALGRSKSKTPAQPSDAESALAVSSAKSKTVSQAIGELT